MLQPEQVLNAALSCARIGDLPHTHTSQIMIMISAIIFILTEQRTRRVNVAGLYFLPASWDFRVPSN